MIEEVHWEYSYTLDPIPQQVPEHNKVYRFFAHLREGRLTTTRCMACVRTAWPPRTVCPHCLSDQLEWVDLPKQGKIMAVSVQAGGAPPGYQPPLVFAAVEITPEIHFIARLVETDGSSLAPGQEVELVVVEVPQNRVLPAFRPCG